MSDGSPVARRFRAKAIGTIARQASLGDLIK